MPVKVVETDFTNNFFFLFFLKYSGAKHEAYLVSITETKTSFLTNSKHFLDFLTSMQIRQIVEN